MTGNAQALEVRFLVSSTQPFAKDVVDLCLSPVLADSPALSALPIVSDQYLHPDRCPPRPVGLVRARLSPGEAAALLPEGEAIGH